MVYTDSENGYADEVGKSDLGSIIKAIRTSFRPKLTQRGLAKRMDVGQSDVSKWETNKAMPDALQLIRLAAVLQQPLDAFGMELDKNYKKWREALLKLTDREKLPGSELIPNEFPGTAVTDSVYRRGYPADKVVAGAPQHEDFAASSPRRRASDRIIRAPDPGDIEQLLEFLAEIGQQATRLAIEIRRRIKGGGIDAGQQAPTSIVPRPRRHLPSRISRGPSAKRR